MGENLEEKLFRKKENGWNTVDTRKKEAIFNFAKDYMNFLNKAKTEREFIVEATKMAQENGSIWVLSSPMHTFSLNFHLSFSDLT